MTPCPECKGTGERATTEHDGTPTTVPCEVCAGEREVSDFVSADYIGWAVP